MYPIPSTIGVDPTRHLSKTEYMRKYRDHTDHF